MPKSLHPTKADRPSAPFTFLAAPFSLPSQAPPHFQSGRPLQAVSISSAPTSSSVHSNVGQPSAGRALVSVTRTSNSTESDGSSSFLIFLLPLWLSLLNLLCGLLSAAQPLNGHFFASFLLPLLFPWAGSCIVVVSPFI